MHDGKGKEGELATQDLSSAFALDCLLEPRVNNRARWERRGEELATQKLSSALAAFAPDCLLEPRVKGKRSNLSLSSYLGLCGFWILDRFR